MVTIYAYELFTIIPSLSYIWMDSRLKGFSIESKNIPKMGFGRKNYDRPKLKASYEQ